MKNHTRWNLSLNRKVLNITRTLSKFSVLLKIVSICWMFFYKYFIISTAAIYSLDRVVWIEQRAGVGKAYSFYVMMYIFSPQERDDERSAAPLSMTAILWIMKQRLKRNYSVICKVTYLLYITIQFIITDYDCLCWFQLNNSYDRYSKLKPYYVQWFHHVVS